MVPLVLLALPAILSRPILFGRVGPGGATIFGKPHADLALIALPTAPAPRSGPTNDEMREMGADGIEVRVGTASTWATEGFVLRRQRGVWSGQRQEPGGWVPRPVAKGAGDAVLRALHGFERWPDSPPPITIGNDVPLTTVGIAYAGRWRSFSGLTGGTDEAGKVARLVREALD